MALTTSDCAPSGTIFGPAYQTKGTAGVRSVEPNGLVRGVKPLLKKNLLIDLSTPSFLREVCSQVVAPLFITVPWDVKMGQVLHSSDCRNSTDITANLTQLTNYSCLSAVDMGVVYGTSAKTCSGSGRGKKCVSSVDYAVWDGVSCVTCQVAGNSSGWKWASKTGSIGYVRKVSHGLQPQSLWIIPTATVSCNTSTRR